jgi:hypothetical protein
VVLVVVLVVVVVVMVAANKSHTAVCMINTGCMINTTTALT